MANIFSKINLNLPNIDLNNLLGDISQNMGGYDVFKICKIKNSTYLDELLKDKIVFNIPPRRVNITIIEPGGANYAHTDVNSVALNYYIKAEEEITTFFDNPDGHKNPSFARGAYSYDIQKLIPISHFQAKTNECYLLNTHIPHLVTNVHEKYDRIILRFIWNKKSFDEILESIEIL